MIYDHNTGQSRCFGFVEFNDSYSLDLALSIKSHIIDGRDIECKYVYLKSELEDIDQTKKLGKKGKIGKVGKKNKKSKSSESTGEQTELTEQTDVSEVCAEGKKN